MTNLWPRVLSDAGLRFLPPNPRAAVRTGTVAVIGVSLFVIALDLLLAPSRDYIFFYTSPLMPRTPLTILRACLEEIEFRLVLMSGLLLGGALLRRRRPSAPWFVGAIVLAQFVNVMPFVIADPIYATLRYWVPGLVWGWLYWRHGWITALAAHAAVHALLDPILLFLLSS